MTVEDLKTLDLRQLQVQFIGRDGQGDHYGIHAEFDQISPYEANAAYCVRERHIIDCFVSHEEKYLMSPSEEYDRGWVDTEQFNPFKQEEDNPADEDDDEIEF